jgi:endonuclease-3
MNKKNVLNSIISVFEKENPAPKTELIFTDEFTLLVAVILSAQATDKMVNKVTEKLFAVYKNPSHFANLKEEELYVYTKSITYFKTKSKNIINLSKILIEKYQSNVPLNFEDLIELPGVGRKTANVILSNLKNEPVIAVDTHVHSVANRIGLVKTKNREKTEKDLVKLLGEKNKKYAPNLHNWLVLHGRYVCKARKPNCASCKISDFCKSKNKN